MIQKIISDPNMKEEYSKKRKRGGNPLRDIYIEVFYNAQNIIHSSLHHYQESNYSYSLVSFFFSLSLFIVLCNALYVVSSNSICDRCARKQYKHSISYIYIITRDSNYCQSFAQISLVDSSVRISK
ncbi:predicted protein [Candida tropicalis MYA-3404]|uniref:Uncharacterized protein n=1 Tax=Candida tropicalis (strain ATCC MYA-3404 / T1) TaxID=294747 RepID=C5MFU7_CANTT|nr:predicted protein [Candida tropicalis MYA-3404]EER31210.1 predicted protein [Candida tropicalis MYA-3404]KAG4404774.1 hypothetical protein JTP64_005788 [Candida tropicalis]